MNVYDLGDLVALTGRFYSDAAKTTPADPTTVVLSIRDPNRVITTPAVTNAGVGVRTYSWIPTIPGMYEVNWAGTGAVVSADQEPVYISVGVNLGQLYLSPDQLKSTLEMSGTNFADPDVTLAIGAASRSVDEITGRRFWLDADNTKVRYYTPRSTRLLQIDDLVALGTNAIAIDRGGTGTYSEVWTNNVDYVLEPFNGPADSPARPWETVRVRYLTTGRWFPTWVEKSVQVTGQFGWSTVPDDVTAATGILAAKLLRRSREAPFGIVTGGIDQAVAMRISRTDPDVYMLLRDYTRHEPFV